MLSRMRDQVERSLGALLIARLGRDDCRRARLASSTGGTASFSPLLRKRVARPRRRLRASARDKRQVGGEPPGPAGRRSRSCRRPACSRPGSSRASATLDGRWPRTSASTKEGLRGPPPRAARTAQQASRPGWPPWPRPWSPPGRVLPQPGRRPPARSWRSDADHQHRSASPGSPPTRAPPSPTSPAIRRSGRPSTTGPDDAGARRRRAGTDGPSGTDRRDRPA